MSEPENYDELLGEMYGNRESLIKALHFYNGEASTKQIRERGEISEGAIYNLLNRMEDWGVIEEVDQGQIGRNKQAKMYQFTDLGYAISSKVVRDNSTTIDDIKSELEEIDTNRKRSKDNKVAISELREDFEEMKQFVEKVESYFEDQEETTQS